MKALSIAILMTATLAASVTQAAGVDSFIAAQRNLGLHQNLHPTDVVRQPQRTDLPAAPAEEKKQETKPVQQGDAQ